MNKTCVAQVMDSSGTRASVELIDVDSDGKETINSLLLQELCSEAKLAPTLPMVSSQGRRGRGGGGGEGRGEGEGGRSTCTCRGRGERE